MKYRESYISDDDFDETLGYDEPQDEPEDCDDYDEDSYNDWRCEQSEKSYENWLESGWGYR